VQAELSFLRTQVEVYKNQQWLLTMERHQLRLQVAVREKERILQEGDYTHLSLFVSLTFIPMSLPFISHEYFYFQWRLRIRELR